MNLQENRIDALDYPISALENQPALSAEELKAYFDGSAEQLMQAHNGMIDALGDRSAAAMVGFAPSNLIPEDNVQDAVEYVRNQLNQAVAGTIPDGAVTAEKLSPALNTELNDHEARLDDLESRTDGLPGRVTAAENAIDSLEAYNERAPFCAQFPLMLLCLTDGAVTSSSRDALASAALGMGYDDHVYQLGEQLAMLCAALGSELPSQAFRVRHTFSALLSYSATREEIARLAPVLRLIRMSESASAAYDEALAG